MRIFIDGDWPNPTHQLNTDSGRIWTPKSLDWDTVSNSVGTEENPLALSYKWFWLKHNWKTAILCWKRAKFKDNGNNRVYNWLRLSDYWFNFAKRGPATNKRFTFTYDIYHIITMWRPQSLSAIAPPPPPPSPPPLSEKAATGCVLATAVPPATSRQPLVGHKHFCLRFDTYKSWI